MRRIKVAALLLMVTLLLGLTGCVELTGQRISWFHDAAGDQLHVMLHYDGIHHHDDGIFKPVPAERSIEQLEQFIRDGDVMLLDWPFHLRATRLWGAAGNPRQRGLKFGDWLLGPLRVQVLGYYREPDGRMGAAQLVTIPDLPHFLGELNRLISFAFLEELDDEEGFQRTVEAIRTASRKGHQWVSVEGHAISFTVPVHPAEWARAKGDFLMSAAREMAKAFGEHGSPEEKAQRGYILRALSSAPVSLIDRGDHVTLVLGHPKRPNTVRWTLRSDYEPSLEKTLRQHAKVNLDERLGASLLAGSDPGPLAPVLEWGPPEERVRALVGILEAGDTEQQAAARKHLIQWANRWNKDGGLPRAPDESEKGATFLEAWKTWYGVVRRPWPAKD